jgi:hypothetical protein
MSMESMNAIISRAASDTSYRVRFFEHFEAAISPYELTPQERTLMRRVTPDKFEGVFRRLEEWSQPPAAASMELMMLIYGPQLQDDAKSSSEIRLTDSGTIRKLGSNKNRTQTPPMRLVAIFAIIVVVGAAVAFGALLALGKAKLQNAPGKPPTIIIVVPQGTATSGP